MKDYERAVSFLAQKKENFPFPNKGADHAAVVVSNILKYAQESVRMFSGALEGEVAQNKNVIKELVKFVERGGKLKILIEREPSENSPLFNRVKELEKAYNTTIIKNAPQEFIDEMRKIFGEIYHFIVADGKSFRIETDTNDYKAICNFNDPEIAESLERLFDKYY